MSAQQLEKVSIIPERERLPAVVTPMAMLAKAVEGGADIDILEKLMGLSERWEANQARKAFDEAVASAKAEIPVIVKNASSHNSKYADFAAIARAVDPVLSKHGIRYRFRTQQNEKSISVTCVLTHKDGHAEENTLTGPVDATVGKNAIQAIGSTLTYLQRYSLVQALGLAASKDDDGAEAITGRLISPSQLAQLNELADEVNADKIKFCKYLRVESLSQIKDKDFDHAMRLLEAKRVGK
jgi:hypothetical protein